MAFIFSILLIVLGVMGARVLVTTKIPAAKDAVAKIMQFQEPLGFLGLVLGLLWFLFWVSSLSILIHFPLRLLLSLATVLTEITLGLLFGLSFVRKYLLRNPASPIMTGADAKRAMLLPHEQQIGIAGIVLGFISLCMALSMI